MTLESSCQVLLEWIHQSRYMKLFLEDLQEPIQASGVGMTICCYRRRGLKLFPLVCSGSTPWMFLFVINIGHIGSAGRMGMYSLEGGR